LTGNEDCGQMSAWYVMSAIGFYPVAPGCDRYWTGITLFDEADVSVAGGKHFRVFARSINANQSATAEPQPWPSIPHQAIVAGTDLSISDGPRADPSRTTSPFRTDLNVPPAPIISAASRTFQDSLVVNVSCLPGPWTIVCTFGSDGDDQIFQAPQGEPVILRNGGWVHAYAKVADDPLGILASHTSARFTKIDGSRTIRLESTYANQYAAGGDQALVDGLRGGPDFRTGDWQGFQGQDVLATIDLGAVKRVERARLSVLQDQGSWIWFPSEVVFAFSVNGRQWSTVSVTNNVSRETQEPMTAELTTGAITHKARYVKIIAKNAGPCPDWHPGKGGASWIFADEVLIETK
ncbi:MAG TPA: glycoside hydrolase domain-containing protein, partial [Flavobacteriales bacterium]|nr:glycoside hydrolase domain-containing protein [Flavobacteriales bacterium]